MFKVIDVSTGESHGKYETMDEARGCVSFDQLTDWEIWNENDVCVDYRT